VRIGGAPEKESHKLCLQTPKPQQLAARKFFEKIFKKLLQFFSLCSMIIRHAYANIGEFCPFLRRLQTARYAMMREVATGTVGFSAEYVRF